MEIMQVRQRNNETKDNKQRLREEQQQQMILKAERNKEMRQ